MTLLDSLIAHPPPLQAHESGVLRVRGTRVRLETVLYAFNQGAAPEEILLKFPSLQLTDIYAVITYFLWHRPEVEDYLAQRKQHVDNAAKENEVQFPPGTVRQRLLSRPVP